MIITNMQNLSPLEGWKRRPISSFARALSTGLTVDALETAGITQLFDAQGMIGLTSASAVGTPYITIIKDGAGVGKVRLLPAESTFLGTMNGLLTDCSVELEFFYYVLAQSSFLLENVTTIPHIYFKDYSKEKILVPPLAKQKKIVGFLDVETAKIDHLITKQQELITLLQERMSAFAEDVLVKGLVLEGNASMEQRRVKHLFKLRDERNHRERQEVTLLSLYTQYGVRKYDEIEERTGNPVRTVEDYKCVRQGDIIVNIILAWMGSIGRSPYDGVISPAYDIWMPVEGISSHYYHYLFRTKWFSGECYKRGKGIMMMRWRTYADQFGDISVPFPSRQEQEHVVNLIEQEQARVEKLIMKARRMIVLLQERRSALITAAVTGKIEV